MKEEVLFMPLGGGQRVGASCYYMRLGRNNIILDAGSGFSKGMRFDPVFSELMRMPSFYSLKQIDQIFISHAHMDHIGYLFELMSEASTAGVYMTDMTRSLTELQLYERTYFSRDSASEKDRLSDMTHLDRITSVSYLKTINFADFRVTFYPAGHIPGAMMILFESENRSILYTGDYSVDDSPLTPGCFVPRDKKIDTLILCGLHAKHPNYVKYTDDIYKTIGQVFRLVNNRRISVRCNVAQLSKGVELIKLLNERNTDNIPIFIGESIMQVIRKMERSGIKILSENNRQMLSTRPDHPHIYVSARRDPCSFLYENCIDADFSLHEDYHGMRQFIKQVDPKHAVIVHCADAYCKSNRTIEQDILLDSECQTQFTFAEEQEIYKI